MICVLALIVCAILGIFSAKYRVIAKDAFDCVFRKITLRKCDSRLDSRLKAQISGSLMRRWKAGGEFLFKYFEWFSWFFLILTLVSLFFMGLGVYNYALYGNCNGPNSNEFCIFDPLGSNNHVAAGEAGAGATCSIPSSQVENKTLAPPALMPQDLREGAYKGSKDAKVVIIELGCYECHYTKAAEPTIKKVVEHYGNDILYVYRDFHTRPDTAGSVRASQAAHCALDQGKYWEFRDALFANPDNMSEDSMNDRARALGLDITQFSSCVDARTYENWSLTMHQASLDSGASVTPTFFINNETLIGAKQYGDFTKVIDKELGRKNFWQTLMFWQ